jgi:3-hydroxybutyryl-CoA dehydratase
MMFKIKEEFNHEFIISETIYHGFIDLFRDQNPIHTNPLFASKFNFKDKVMHGNILNGFLSYFIGELLPLKNVVIVSQQINFKNPVYLNDILVFKSTVHELYESVNIVTFKYSFIKNDRDTVANGKIQIKILK